MESCLSVITRLETIVARVLLEFSPCFVTRVHGMLGCLRLFSTSFQLCLLLFRQLRFARDHPTDHVLKSFRLLVRLAVELGFLSSSRRVIVVKPQNFFREKLTLDISSDVLVGGVIDHLVRMGRSKFGESHLQIRAILKHLKRKSHAPGLNNLAKMLLFCIFHSQVPVHIQLQGADRRRELQFNVTTIPKFDCASGNCAGLQRNSALAASLD
mmetsp:Transcript_21407/g.50328  ORF Transcript_21407/g.50328 Transcript_21407/m.50328 type:complete len:212 (-) Transcript_21407:255-890(-)